MSTRYQTAGSRNPSLIEGRPPTVIASKTPDYQLIDDTKSSDFFVAIAFILF
jgi:hypothetical protein